MRAIDSCRVFVLVFSENANDSEHVRRGFGRESIFSLGLAVIPFRTDPVSPNRSLGYFLETVHWLDAITPPLQNHLGALTEQVKQLIGDDQEPAPGGRETASAQDPPSVPPALPKQPDKNNGVARPSKSLRWLLKFNLAFVPILVTGISLPSPSSFATSCWTTPNRKYSRVRNSCWKQPGLRERTPPSRSLLCWSANKNEIEKSTQIVRKALETAEKLADAGKRQTLLNVLSQVRNKQRIRRARVSPAVDTVLRCDRSIQLFSTNPSRLRLQRSCAQSDQSARSDSRLGGTTW